jgi:hypothetical protein
VLLFEGLHVWTALTHTGDYLELFEDRRLRGG